MSDDIQRTLGEHSATLKTLGETVAKMDTKLDQLVASENKRDGGRKVVWGIAAAVGALSSGMVEALTSRLLK